MILVTTLFPTADGVIAEICAEFAQVLADRGVGEAVVEHLVELVADGFGEAGDGAATLTG
jgi:hypothetical protein